MKKIRWYGLPILASVILLLSGCKLGHHYTRPDLHMPVRLDEQRMDSLSVADMKWWELYSDSTLKSLIASTLENNKDLKIAAARVKELAAMKRIDYAGMFPKLDLRLHADREGENYGGNAYDADNSYELHGIFSWELDLWGNLRWAKDKSMAEFLSSVENRRALQMTLVAQVAQSYFELLALDNEYFVVTQTVQARRESVRLARIRFEGGLTSETAYKQAQVELARTSTLLPDLERRISLKENELSVLMGEYPQHIRRQGILQKVHLPDYLPVGLSSSLLERRPDVRRSEQDLIAANAAVGVAYTNLFPRLQLTATLGAESDDIGNLLKSPYYSLAGNLLQPIFAMGRNRALHKAKKEAYEQAVYRYEKAVLQAFTDVRNAIVDYNKVREIYESRLKLEQASKTAVELAQIQYINGYIGYMDLLDAQRGYLDAQIGLGNALRDKRITLVNLYKALGGGWQQ